MTRSSMILVVLVLVVTAGCDQQNEAEQRSASIENVEGSFSAPLVAEDGIVHANNGLIQGPVCNDANCGKAGGHYPVPDWEVGSPEEHGLSAEGLAEMADLADALDSKCLLIIHDGVLIGEWYWDGYDANSDVPDVLSITKSITSALFGIAEFQGLLDVDDRVSDYVPEWLGTQSEDVTIRQLLVHDSGRTFDLTLEWGLPAVIDQTSYSLAAGQSASPGTQWVYTNLGYQALEAVLDHVLGGDVGEFAQEQLFEPIGMTAELGEDPAGNKTLYSGASASCRDLARFGYLYHQRGRWNGEQILPRNWVKKSRDVSTEFNDAYGIGWWLNNEGYVVLPQVQVPFEYDGRFIPSADEEIYTALGAFGNFVSVDPEEGYIVVRLTDAWDLQDVLGLPKVDALWAAFEDAKL
jgi:CubicO group peptidase (beta-lactamase class C family)